MSFIIKSIFKNNADLNSLVIDKTNEYIKHNKDVIQSVNISDDHIKALVQQVLNQDKYNSTWLQGLRESAIKSSIKQYLREEKTKAIAHLLNEAHDHFKNDKLEDINLEIDYFVESIVNKNVPGNEATQYKQYGDLLTHEEIKLIVKNWHKIAHVLICHQVIEIKKNKNKATMSVTTNAKPIQKAAKCLIKKIDGERFLEDHYANYIDAKLHPSPKALTKLCNNYTNKDPKKALMTLDKAFVSKFKYDFDQIFSPVEKKLLYKAIHKEILVQIENDLAALEIVRTGSSVEQRPQIEQRRRIRAGLILHSNRRTDEPFTRTLPYSIKFKIADGRGWERNAENVFNDFAEKFKEPNFVNEVRALCAIKKENPQLIEDAGFHDTRLFDLIDKFTK